MFRQANTTENIESDEMTDHSDYIPDDTLSDSDSEIEEQSSKKRRSRLIDMPPGYTSRRSWGTEERQAVRQEFGEFIKSGKIPSYNECQHALRKNVDLKSRTPMQIKAWVSNEIKRNIKMKKESKFKGLRKSWGTPEKRICRNEFGEDVARGVYPSRSHVATVIGKYPELKNRTVEMVISHLQHAINKNASK